MFNEQYKKAAINDLENANNQYVQVFKRAINHMSMLYGSRERAVKAIYSIERYVSALANMPRGYETKLGEINIRYMEFKNRIEEIKQLEEKQIKYSENIGGGILTSLGGATVGTNVAIAVAMTFGTASTGMAITSLSGVAATNAALAWLGGGALAVGGTGIVGGEALLATVGPIGWCIGGTAIAGGVLMKIISNSDIAKKAEAATKTIIREKERIQEIDSQVQSWNKETTKLTVELTKKHTKLRQKHDYKKFTEDEKKELALLMNMTEVLSKKIGDKIS